MLLGVKPDVQFTTTAILKALEEERLGGAALDVFVSEKVPLEDHVISLCR